MVQDSNGTSNGTNGHHHAGDVKNIIQFPPKREKDDGPSYPPMINLPPLTKILLAAIIVIHLGVWGIGFINEPLQKMIYAYGAFTPASWSGALPFQWWTPLTAITFSFLHGGWLHLIINGVMLMAFGAGIEKWLGPKRMMILFAGSAATALLCQFAANPDSYTSVVGISGAISGFFGALLIMMQQQRLLGNAKNSILPFIALWIIISIVFGYMGAPDGSPIAWLAHIGGFFGGLLITWLMLGRPRLFKR
jgi:membrane associated rhomboid family serine protease